MRTPSLRSLPMPKFISAQPAASASLIIHASQPQALPISSARFTPTKFLPPRFAAVSIICDLITPGNPQPIGPFHLNPSTISHIAEIMFDGVCGEGVGILIRSPTNSPLTTSTTAPFTPDPPMSSPKTRFLRICLNKLFFRRNNKQNFICMQVLKKIACQAHQ